MCVSGDADNKRAFLLNQCRNTHAWAHSHTSQIALKTNRNIKIYRAEDMNDEIECETHSMNNIICIKMRDKMWVCAAVDFKWMFSPSPKGGQKLCVWCIFCYFAVMFFFFRLLCVFFTNFICVFVSFVRWRCLCLWVCAQMWRTDSAYLINMLVELERFYIVITALILLLFCSV